jgi:integrase
MFLSKKGKIWYVYYENPLTGKRNAKTTKTSHKSEAFKFLTEFKERIKPKPRKIALSDLKAELIKHLKYHVRNSTIKIYESTFIHMEQFWGNILIKFIAPEFIEKFKLYRLEMGVTKATVNKDIRNIRAAFNLAVLWGFIESNPCKGVKLFHLDEKERLAFTEEEIKVILNTIHNDSIKNIILMALNTGCRLDELINLQWRDVNFKERFIIIRNKDDFVTKTGKIRYIPTSSFLLELLNSIKPENLEIGANYYIIGKENHFKYQKTYISNFFKNHLRKLNFPERYHFHCLRHTFITQLARRGVNIYDIKQLAGHSCIETTEIYMHSITDDLRKAVDSLNLGI